MSDFRYIFQADFERVHQIDDNGTFSFVLKAIKPSRIVMPGRHASE